MNDEVSADHTSQYAHSTKSWNGYGTDDDVVDREINPPPRRRSGETPHIRNFLDQPAVRAPNPPDPYHSNFFKRNTPPDTPSTSRVEDHKDEEKANWLKQSLQTLQKMVAKRKKA